MLEGDQNKTVTRGAGDWPVDWSTLPTNFNYVILMLSCSAVFVERSMTHSVDNCR